MTINLSEWGVTEEVLPSIVRGLTDDVRQLADQAAEDRLNRRAPLAGEDTLKAIGRYLNGRGLKVTYRLVTTANGQHIVWHVTEKIQRTLTPEHLAKLRAAAARRKANPKADPKANPETPTKKGIKTL